MENLFDYKLLEANNISSKLFDIPTIIPERDIFNNFEYLMINYPYLYAGVLATIGIGTLVWVWEEYKDFRS